MEQTAQRCSGVFLLRMAARRRDSYSEAMCVHEDGGAKVGRCRRIDGRCCMVTERAEANERVGFKVLK
jgi:hypothetical protein